MNKKLNYTPLPMKIKNNINNLFIKTLMIIGVLILGGFILTQKRSYKVNKILTTSPTIHSNSLTITPSLIKPTMSIDEYQNWLSYSNSQFELYFKYPPNTILKEDKSSFTNINGKPAPYLIFNGVSDFYVNISDKDPIDCKGDCPVIESNEQIILSNGKSITKLNGYIGAIGGNIPQNYLSIVINDKNIYYEFTLNELTKDQEMKLYQTDYMKRQRQPIDEKNIQTFMKVINSISFESNNPSPTIIEFKTNPLWTTYTNEQEKYQIQFPQKYKTQPGKQIGTSVTFLKCPSDVCESGFSISKHDYVSNSPKEWLQSLISTPFDRVYTENVIIQNHQTLILMDPASNTSYVILPISNYAYMFVFPFAVDTEKKNINFIKELLTTFKFNL